MTINLNLSMDLFSCPSELGVWSLINNHFWKFEFRMENYDMYSTFSNTAHTLLALHRSNNIVCVYSSSLKYKAHSYKNILVVPNSCLGNQIYSLKANIMETDEPEDNDEDDMYDCYDLQSTLCNPKHQLYFNTPILFPYSWESLELDIDFKLLQLDLSQYKESCYMIQDMLQLLCSKLFKSCQHVGKKMTNISGGYKELYFGVSTYKTFSCPCSVVAFIANKHKSSTFNYILFSYRLSQLILNF